MTNSPPVFHSDEAAREIEALNRRLDGLTLQKKDGPWYKNVAILISAAAFIASITTSVISGLNSRQQTISADVSAEKAALHTLIQQYNDLQVKNSELRYRATKDSIPSHDPPSALDAAYTTSANDFFEAIRSTINSQSFLIAQQAKNSIEQLGTNASSTDLGEVAYFLAVNGLYGSAERLYDRAILSSKTPLEYSGAKLGLAAIEYKLGDQESVKTMGDAISSFEKFPDERPDKDYMNASIITSYKSWNQFLLNSDCPLKKDNASKAEELLKAMASPFSYSSPNDVQFMKSDVEKNCTT
jgi:hypothetical protein